MYPKSKIYKIEFLILKESFQIGFYSPFFIYFYSTYSYFKYIGYSTGYDIQLDVIFLLYYIINCIGEQFVSGLQKV